MRDGGDADGKGGPGGDPPLHLADHVPADRSPEPAGGADDGVGEQASHFLKPNLLSGWSRKRKVGPWIVIL